MPKGKRILLKNFKVTRNDFEREIDFYLVEGKNQHKCEVDIKL